MKNKDINEISRDIILIRLNKNMTLLQCVKEFYAVMKKHGVMKTAVDKGGTITRNSFEWSMCWASFLSHIHNYFGIEFNVFEAGLPAALVHKQPKKK